MDDQAKCVRCHRYLRSEGSDLCSPCLSITKQPIRPAPANCTECVRDYFANQPELVAQRYPDPDCARATPWCALYDEIIRRIRVANEPLAKMLAKVRMTMKARQVRRTP